MPSTGISHHPELDRAPPWRPLSPDSLQPCLLLPVVPQLPSSQPTHLFRPVSTITLHFYPVGSAPRLTALPALPSPLLLPSRCPWCIDWCHRKCMGPVGAGIVVLPAALFVPPQLLSTSPWQLFQTFTTSHQASSTRPASPLAPDLAFPFPEKIAACSLHPLS